MPKKPMQIAPVLFENVICATCLKGHPELRMIPDLPGQPYVCPPCYDKIIPPTKVKKKEEETNESTYTIEPLFS
jgi:hypothetical protein